MGLNAFLERKGTRVLLVMTAGLRDAYSIARHDRKELYTLQYRKPERLVPRRDVYEVVERLRWDGGVEQALDEASLQPVIDAVKREGIEAVAVCLIHAYVNPVHELAAREVLQRECPGLSVTLSHEIAREWREYERASTAVLNAYVAPRVEGYLRSLEEELAARDVKPRLHVMQSNGGITTAAKARQQPVQTLLSGPVGGTIGGAALSKVTGRPNLLCIDMGGTSFDLSLIVDGRPTVSTETELEGLPILMPLVDIHTIGAGGGSLGWLEAGGLRVGPAERGRRARPGLLRARRHRADGHGRQPPSRPARPRVLPRRPDEPRPRGSRAARSTRSARSSGSRRRRSPRGCSRSSTRTWPTRCGRSPSSRASTRATTRSSPSAAQARCTPSGWPRSSRSAR